jgi:hypothetical protein
VFYSANQRGASEFTLIMRKCSGKYERVQFAAILLLQRNGAVGKEQAVRV